MEPRGPNLSVVVPAYNAGSTIADQLDALVRQLDAPSYEVLVCDNGSTDATLEITGRYAALHPQIRVVDSSARKGASYARNRGAQEALADRIAFCDADDVVCPGWLRAMSEALADHDYVVGPLEYDELNVPWVADARERTQTDAPQFLRGGPVWGFGLSANIGVRRAAHEAVGGFDEALPYGGEDADYAWRLQLAGSGLHFAPGAILHLRCRTDFAALYGQMRAYGASHHALYTRWRAYWPVAPPSINRRDWLRMALTRVRWIRSRRGLAFYVRELGWTAGQRRDLREQLVTSLSPVRAPGEPAG